MNFYAHLFGIYSLFQDSLNFTTTERTIGRGFESLRAR